MCILYGKERNTKNISLNGLIEDKVNKYGEKTALICNDSTVSYRQMDIAVKNLASYLIDKVEGKEPLVGIYMDRSEKMIISILAVLKAGGAYVPLDPSHPSERNNYIMNYSQMNVVITESKYESILPGNLTKIYVDDIWDEIMNGELKEGTVLSNHSNDSLAYVIFTSGSTGKPKGVEVEHEGMVNYLLSVSDNLKLNEDVIGLTVVTITFDISISEMFLPLINGGTLVVADTETAKNGTDIVKLIEKENIDLCGFTPSTAYMLLDSGLNNIDGMKMLIGGEPWSMELAKLLIDAGCTQVWNVYGPTETTIYSTMYQLNRDDDHVSIGIPIEQTDIYVLDENLKPVNKGEEGDLYIGGIGVARGYYRNPELTSKSFIANPIDKDRGRIYKTGDVVKYIDDEDIVYVGRSDFQVKLHGYRIELGEIEAALCKMDEVSQAVAVIQGKELDAKIHAFIKLKDECKVEAADVRAFAEDLLPSYMVPGMYTFVLEYPMTANFKVDRKALMEGNVIVAANATEYVAPRNEIEEMIAEIWEELLNVDKVSVCDDFLELGGHSLLANRLVVKMNNVFGTTITLLEIFERTMTIEEMALIVEENLLSGLSEEEIEELMKEGLEENE